MVTLGAPKIPSSVSNAMCLRRWLVGQRLMWDFLSTSAPSSALGPPFARPSQRSGSMLSSPEVFISYLRLKTFEPGEDSDHHPWCRVPRAASAGILALPGVDSICSHPFSRDGVFILVPLYFSSVWEFQGSCFQTSVRQKHICIVFQETLDVTDNLSSACFPAFPVAVVTAVSFHK